MAARSPVRRVKKSSLPSVERAAAYSSASSVLTLASVADILETVANRFSLEIHGEQAPRADSRVTLGASNVSPAAHARTADTSAADGVVSWLERNGRGYDTPGGLVPLVPGAVVYDLISGDPTRRPGPAWQPSPRSRSSACCRQR